LVAGISRLQRNFDRANESIYDKLDKQEEAGLGVVALTKKLEEARARITALEQEISKLFCERKTRFNQKRKTSFFRCARWKLSVVLV
jgi:chromosome segregation ATPase